MRSRGSPEVENMDKAKDEFAVKRVPILAGYNVLAAFLAYSFCVNVLFHKGIGQYSLKVGK